MSEPLVRFAGVRRTFEGGRVRALDGVDLEVAPREFVAITGPSGSGKSTLLNLMGAMDLPDEGSVTVDGIRVVDRESMERVRATRIGFVFQRFNLLPILNALENVEIPMWGRDGDRRALRARALELLGLVGLADRARADVRVLSGGEQQRVAIARALIHAPKLLLADEPTGNLDSRTGAGVMEVLHEARIRNGAALVVVTHDPGVTRDCDRRLHLVDGRIVDA